MTYAGTTQTSLYQGRGVKVKVTWETGTVEWTLDRDRKKPLPKQIRRVAQKVDHLSKSPIGEMNQ